MAQINKRITGLAAPFVKGKAVVNDGTFHTKDFIVDGMGGTRGTYSKINNSASGTLTKIAENYYAYFGLVADKATNVARVVIDIYKVSGKNLIPVKTVIRNDINPNMIRGAYVDGNKSMIAYRDAANSFGKVFMATFNPATEEMTFTADFIFFSAAISGSFTIAKSGTNRALIVYGNNTGATFGTVATFLEPDIIFGSAIQINANSIAYNIAILESSPGNFVISAWYSSPADLILNLVSVTGATITVLTNVTLHASTTAFKTSALLKVEDNHLLVYTSDAVSTYQGRVYPVTIDPATNAMTAAPVIVLGDTINLSGGFPVYDQALGKFFYFGTRDTLETYAYDKAAKTLTKEASEYNGTRVREIRPIAGLASASAHNTTEYFQLTANLFLCVSHTPQRNLPVNSTSLPSPLVFIFDTSKIKRPLIMGVASGDDTYIEEGLVTGLVGLKPGEAYFVNPNAELVTGDKLNVMLQTDTINNMRFTHEFIGYAISETELVIPRRKTNTTYL